ncbi:hypothetical protein HO133_006612 [Letharia lupina]|uniref:Uncharacterized protein n=1 Tax=Letharia lupina TaxID=560253 RepID=A0A8H6C611_9LECA|nr:uncharacterized protein HO133_006612 [Letharia lupina]KAF6217785.1 hypothetical protein HO133_006612 [Letharia lupina]
MTGINGTSAILAFSFKFMSLSWKEPAEFRAVLEGPDRKELCNLVAATALKSNPKYMSAVGVPSARVLPDAAEAIAKANKEGFKQGMAVTKKETKILTNASGAILDSFKTVDVQRYYSSRGSSGNPPRPGLDKNQRSPARFGMPGSSAHIFHREDGHTPESFDSRFNSLDHHHHPFVVVYQQGGSGGMVSFEKG